MAHIIRMRPCLLRALFHDELEVVRTAPNPRHFTYLHPRAELEKACLLDGVDGAGRQVAFLIFFLVVGMLQVGQRVGQFDLVPRQGVKGHSGAHGRKRLQLKRGERISFI